VFSYSMCVRKLQSDKCVECSGNSRERAVSTRLQQQAYVATADATSVVQQAARTSQLSPRAAEITYIYTNIRNF